VGGFVRPYESGVEVYGWQCNNFPTQKPTTALEVLMQQQEETTIVNITDNAAEKVKALMAQEGEEDLALRIGVRPGGCSGFQYSIYFDDEIADDDEVLETKGVKVLVDAMSVPYIMGSEFDYVDGLMGAGFAVNNPNVQGGCGCGSSFTC
jgi:iron-sulfur cluster assembly accessory protein